MTGTAVDDVVTGPAPDETRGRAALPVVAVGAAACVACCAPPILAAVGITVGLSGLAWFTGGLLLAAVVALLGAAFVVRRRRRGGA